MSTFELCQQCRRTATRIGKRSLPCFSLCKECVEERLKRLAPIFRDRSYRAHLARRIWGMPCDKSSNCPEDPPGHATYDVSGQGAIENQAYECLVTWVSLQFNRPYDARSITAFELLAGHHLVSSVKYCPTCLSRAMDCFPEENNLVTLCGGCLRIRNSHVQTVHAGQGQFSEPWEKKDRLSFSVLGRSWELDGHANQGLDDLIKRCFAPILRAGAGDLSPAVLIAIIGLLGTFVTCATIVTFGVRTWLQQNKIYWYNTRMLEIIIRQNAWTMFNDNRNFRFSCAQSPEYQPTPQDRSDLEPSLEELEAGFYQPVGRHSMSAAGCATSPSGHHSSAHRPLPRSNNARNPGGDIPLTSLPRPLRQVAQLDTVPGESARRSSSGSQGHHVEYQAPSSGAHHPTSISTTPLGTRRSSTSSHIPMTGEHQPLALRIGDTASISPRPTTNRSSSRTTTLISEPRSITGRPALVPHANNTANTSVSLPRTGQHSAEMSEPRSPTTSSSQRRRIGDHPALVPHASNTANTSTSLSRTERHSVERPTMPEPRSTTRKSSDTAK